MEAQVVKRMVLESELLEYLFADVIRWIKDNPEEFIENINIQRDECQGIWYVYIYY